MNFKIGDIIKYKDDYKKIVENLESEGIFDKSFKIKHLHKLTEFPYHYIIVTECDERLIYSDYMEIDTNATRIEKIKIILE